MYAGIDYFRFTAAFLVIAADTSTAKRYKEYLSDMKVIRIAGIVAEIRVAATNIHNQGFYSSIG
ncbi:hypothetical protein ACIQ1D_25110 [Lysinibacillus xylanilyticus]|uniref:hypothetical protein n=1 Tax=Lysinibacillus xylanilyticus TaxID=582475 RepID=UPI003824DC22